MDCQEYWLVIDTFIFASKPVSLSLNFVSDLFKICVILTWTVIELPIILIRYIRTLLFLVFFLLILLIDFVFESENQWASSDNA